MTIPGLPDARDIRRAAALIQHANPNAFDVAGINAVLAEIHVDHRTTELILATATICHALMPKLTGETGTAGLRQIIADYALKESTTDEGQAHE